MSRDNVRRIPIRRELPPELVAAAIPQGKDDTQLIINSAEEPRGIIAFLRPDIYVPILMGWALEWTWREVRSHPAASVLATAAASTALATGAHLALNGDEAPLAKPAVTIMSVVPDLVVTVTATPQAISTSQANSPTVERTTPPPDESRRSRERRASPLPTGTPPPTSRRTEGPQPTRSTTRPSSTSQPADVQTTPPRENRTPSDEPQPPPAQQQTADPPASTAEPTPEQTAAARSTCLLRVDINPVLDACVLG